MFMKKNKIMIFLTVIVFIITNFINIYVYLNYKKHNIYLNNNFNINLIKIIIIGDSRMELIENDREKLNIPRNIVFKARSGARINWLNKVAIPWLSEQLNQKNKKYKYMVLFNLGVNDLNSNIEPSDIAKDYLGIYRNIIFQNQDVNFYFLSVNPIDEKIINNFFINQKRSNKKIEEFNNYFINNIKNFNNINYCDSYNSLNLNFYDGLHFDFETNKIILDYILNDCFIINNFSKFK